MAPLIHCAKYRSSADKNGVGMGIPGTRVRLQLVAVVVQRASFIYRLGRPLLNSLGYSFVQSMYDELKLAKGGSR
jgi:hypothetical protein